MDVMKCASELIRDIADVVEVSGHTVSIHRHSADDTGLKVTPLRDCRDSLPEYFSSRVDTGGTGVFVSVKNANKSKHPLAIVSGNDAEGAGESVVVIDVEPENSAEIIFIVKAGCRTKRVVRLGRGAALRLKGVFESETGGMTEIDSEIELAAYATIGIVSIAVGSGDVRSSFRTSLLGRRASSRHYGLFMAADGETKKMDVRVEHMVPDCRSEVTVKGVAAGTGYGEFSGMVYVAPDAQHTEAYQQSRNLLIGDKARVQTSPQLEIYADDVKCSHGATVGQMDDEAIFYMRQRGLSESEAKGLRLEGFVNDIVRLLGDEKTVECVMEQAASRFSVQ